MLRPPAQHLQNCLAFCSHFRGLKPPATLQDRLQWPCSSVSPKWLIYLYWSSLVSPKWFNYLCTWNEHCQQKLYTDNLESYTGRISWAIFPPKKCVGRLHALSRWVLLFLVLYLSLEVLCQPDASPWHLPRAGSSTWETHSFSKRSGEEFNKVWVYLSFREICNRYFCICHMYVSDQSIFFLLMLEALSKAWKLLYINYNVSQLIGTKIQAT